MRKRCCFFFIAIAVISYTSAQNKPAAQNTIFNKQNGWYAEIAGQSLFGATLNYERYFTKTPGGFSAHIGAGGGYLYHVFSDGAYGFAAFPVGAAYNIPVSGNKHFIELSTNYSLLLQPGDPLNIVSLGGAYHYQAPSGFQLKVTLLPVVYSINDNAVVPWFGVGLGKRF